MNIWASWVPDGVTLTVLEGKSDNVGVYENTRKFMNSELDFLFIDGSHKYKDVKKDYEMYGGLVREGGIIAIHDIGGKEDVYKFWNEIRKNHKTEDIINLERDKPDYGIGVVYV